MAYVAAMSQVFSRSWPDTFPLPGGGLCATCNPARQNVSITQRPPYHPGMTWAVDEQSSIPVDQDFYAASSVAVVSSGRSTSLPFSNFAPARTSATRWGALTARQRDWAASISLYYLDFQIIVREGAPVHVTRPRAIHRF